MKLAIQGGPPVRASFLSYGQQWIEEDDIEAVVETLKSPYLTQGPKIYEFETRVAEYVGANYAVAFSNGTAALHAACFAAGIEEGDEVITTPLTFVASANCVLYRGAKPVFADIDAATYNIDPKGIEKLITPKTKAIIPVDFTGQPVDLDAIRKIAEKHQLVVIEDAAHALGATYKGRKVGTFSDMTMFSFHPVKHITTGEGGIIVTDSEDYAKKLRLFRTHGIIKDNISEDQGPWYYEMVSLGFNYRLTDMQASLGLSQLQKLDDFITQRMKWAERYNGAFKAMPELVTPFQLAETDSSWHLYVIRLNLHLLKVSRKEIFEALHAENIGVQVHYIPVYYQPYYKKLGYEKGLCPIAEETYDAILSLPLFPKMTLEDVESVIEGVKKVVSFYKK